MKNINRLGIVIPLKSKAASRNWSITCTSLEDTIRSIDNQTSNNFEAIIVGHETPNFLNKGKHNITFHKIENDPPKKAADEFTQEDYTLDKNSKIIRGMQLIKNRGVSYWFTLDADDLMDRHFVEIILDRNLQSGCIIDGGHVIYKSRKRVVPHDNISLLCGSTSILCNEYIEIPEKLDKETMKSVPWCRYSHTDMTKYFENELNAPYTRISDRLIGYVMGHGDNCSDGYRMSIIQKVKSYLKPLIIGQRLTEKVKKLFIDSVRLWANFF